MNPRTPLTTTQAVAILRALRPHRPRSPGSRRGAATAADHDRSSLPLPRQCSSDGTVTLARESRPGGAVVPGDRRDGVRLSVVR